ncbi:MAG: hypothetical protein OXL68_16205 [Paracoccaceae bacterium]|nr:hypothetical protein [Paracoccaceae bacterium]
MNARATETVNAKRRMACQYVKVAVKVKNRCAHAYRNCSDKTVYQLANGFSPAAAKPEGRQLPHSPQFRWNSFCTRKQAAKIAQMFLVLGTGKNLHANGVANGNFVAKYIPGTITHG